MNIVPKSLGLVLAAIIWAGPLRAQTTVYVPDGTVGTSSNGNVGVGTSTPSAKLEVSGTVRVSDATASSSASTGAFVVTGGAGIGGNLFVGGKVHTDVAAGVFGAGGPAFWNWVNVSGSGDSGGTTDISGLFSGIQGTGSNNFTRLRGALVRGESAGSGGTISTLGGVVGQLRLTGSTNVTFATAVEGSTVITSTTNLPSVAAIFASPPFYTSSGRALDVKGFYAADLGNATSTTVTGLYLADQTKGSGSVYGIRSQISAASGKYNLYLDGSGQNFLAGLTGIGTTPSSNSRLVVGGGIAGATTAYGVFHSGTIQSDVTVSYSSSFSQPNTAASSFSLSDLTHYASAQGTIGSGSSVTTQTGFLATVGMTGATNNYGFRGQIPAGTGRYNLYMDGTAANFLAGNVGIGTTSSSHKLAVNGTVRAKEVIVDTGWSDYVFAEEYRLAPLSEVEAHIKEHKHLPGIPSAAKVEQEGVSLGEMQALLLAKIEELTLHLIEQERRVEQQAVDHQREIAGLRAELVRLSSHD